MSTLPNNEHTMHALIARYLAGEATAEEAMQLDDWLADANHAQEYERIKALWQRLPGETAPQVPAAGDTWQELAPLLSTRKRPLLIRLLRHRAVAACLIGVLLLGGLIWLNRQLRPPQRHLPSTALVHQASATATKTTTLPDGTTITLQRNSQVTYSAGFHQAHRQVDLQGEGYFEVAHDTQHPFQVRIGELTIQVVGTSFNVRDITPPGQVEVPVRSGVVKMFTSQQAITVQKGQTGIYDKTLGTLVLQDTLDINSFGYATRSFVFNDIAFTEACRYLEKAFPVTIVVDSDSLAGCRLSAQFDNKPLPYILDIINATLNTSYRQQGDTIYFRGQGCR